MRYFTPGGFHDVSWGAYVLLGLIAVPFVIGLALRLGDRRKGADRPLTWRRWAVRAGVAASCLVAAVVAFAILAEAVAAVSLLGALVFAPTARPPVAAAAAD